MLIRIFLCLKSFICIRLISILLSGLLGYFHAAGQNKPASFVFPVTIHNVEDGLAQSTVYQVFQDKTGLIWVTTGGGLQCFDGNSFLSFDLQEEILKQTPGNPMYVITGSSDGKLIVSTGSSVINFDVPSGRYSLPSGQKTQYPLFLHQFFKNKPLCWMSSDGLYMIGHDRIYPVRLSFVKGECLPGGFSPVNAVKTKNGTILIASEEGLLELKESSSARDTVLDAKWIPSKMPYRHLFTNHQGDAYLLAEGVIYSVGERGILKELINTGIWDGSYLYIDRQNNFWISDIMHKRTYRLTRERMNEIKFVSREGKHIDTIQPAVRSFFEDERGNIWFGTDGNGLLFHTPGQIIFDFSGIGFTRCMAFYNGEIWAGTFKNGLWRLPLDLDKKTRVNPGVLTNKLYFFDLFLDPSERLWALTSHGVYILNKNGSVVYHYQLKTTSGNFLFLPGNKVLLSTYGDLYSCETGDSPGLKYIRKQTQIKEAVFYNNCYWIGNHFGLYRTDTASGLLASMSFQSSDRITHIPVFCIRSFDGIIWAGTEHGIRLFSSSGERLKTPAYLDEMKNEIVYSLIHDTRGRIWFSGNKGAGCIPASRDRVIRFYQINNLQSSEFNFNADLSIRGEMIFFGGIRGINGIETNNIVIENALPTVRLISLNISDSSYTPGIPQGKIQVKLHWSNPQISGRVFTPEYFPPGTVDYSFFLEGYQLQWSNPSNDPSFSYRNLPPGKYRLWARCIDPYKNQGTSRIPYHTGPRARTWGVSRLPRGPGQ